MTTFYMYESKEAAEKAFKDIEVEQCGKCERWSASFADHTHGAIVSDSTGYDRICLECDDELAEIET